MSGDGQMDSHLVSGVAEANRALKLFNEEKAAQAPEFKVVLLRNYSAEFVEPFLRYYFSRAELRCELQLGGFTADNTPSN